MYHTYDHCQIISQANLSSATAPSLTEELPMDEIYTPSEHPFDFDREIIRQASSIKLTKRLNALLKSVAELILKGKEGRCIASHEFIGRYLLPSHGWKAMTRDSVCRALSELRAMGLLHTVKRVGETYNPTFASRVNEPTQLGWAVYFSLVEPQEEAVDRVLVTEDLSFDFIDENIKTPYCDLKNPIHINILLRSSYSSSFNKEEYYWDPHKSVDNLFKLAIKELTMPVKKLVYLDEKLGRLEAMSDRDQICFAIECIKMRLDPIHHNKAIEWLKYTTARGWKLFSALESVIELGRKQSIGNVDALLDHQYRKLMFGTPDALQPLRRTQPIKLDKDFVKAPIRNATEVAKRFVDKMDANKRHVVELAHKLTDEVRQKAAVETAEYMEKMKIPFTQRDFDLIMKTKLNNLIGI